MNNKYSGYIVSGILMSASLSIFTAVFYHDIKSAIKDIINYTPSNVQPTSQPSESQRKIIPSRIESALLHSNSEKVI